MSFRCDGCHDAQPDKTRPVVVVVAQRRVVYSTRVIRGRDEETVKSEGLETAKEARLCPSCADEISDAPPKILGVKTIYS